MNLNNLFLLLFCTFLLACNSNNRSNETSNMDEANTGGQEISEEKLFDAEDFSDYSFIEYVKARDNFKTMALALEATGILDSLVEADNYTLFLPTDAAFDQIPQATLTEWMMLDNRDELRAIVKYHLFPGELTSNGITDGFTVNTMSGNELLFNISEAGITINMSARVLDADIKTENGTIHIINEVLIPKGA